MSKTRLLIIDGIKVRFETNELDFWDAYIEPSVAGDIIMLHEWIIRGAVDFGRAIEIARTIIPLKRMGYQIMHCDAEGRIIACNTRQMIEEFLLEQKAEAWKGENQPSIPSNRFSHQDAEGREIIRKLVAEAEAEHNWSNAPQVAGLSDEDALAKIGWPRVDE
jgi:hypothetical protein